jgi:hypothetical protein
MGTSSSAWRGVGNDRGTLASRIHDMPNRFLLGVLGLRTAYGAGLLLVPDRLTRRWLGAGGRTPSARVALRALGAREVVLHGLALGAALRGAPVRPFLAASVAGDCADIAATFASRRGLPPGAAPATAAVAGASAAISVAAAARA